MCGESLLFVGIYILARIWSSGECRSEVWQERSASHKYKTCKKKFWRAKNLRRRRAWTRQHSLLFEFIQCSWKVLNWCFLCDRVSVTQMAVSQGCTISSLVNQPIVDQIFSTADRRTGKISPVWVRYLTNLTIFISVENCFATRPVFFRCIQYS